MTAVSAAETEIRYLSGTGPEDAVAWDFFCTGGRNSGAWSKIAVPSCWEQQGFGNYNYGRNMDPRVPVPFADEQGKYRLEFSVPAAWRGQHVRLVFDGAMTDTSVWINGQSAGATHQGSFYRFHYDITPLLKFGDNEKNLLEVTVAKMSSNASVNRAERQADYWVFGGIFRPVWLEARPPQFIEWTAVDAKADGSFLAQVNLGAAAPGARVTAQIETLDGVAVGSPLVATANAEGTRAELRGRFDNIKTWTAETPQLYRVRFAVGTQHTVTERFGFRTIEVRENDGVYLNGTKIVLKGVNRHCFWPETGRTLSRAQSYADARLIKEANMNAVRMSHYPPDKHFLEACDELGLYVLHELAGWQGFYDTPTGARLIGQLIRRDVNHPSVLFWDNGNEGGWNTENDGEFAKWDLQQRTVLHPWAIHGGINTDHYEKYDSTVKLSAGPMIFMPTEMLHGLWDGGIGAGFRDYWDVMGKSPTVAGAFFWVWADEGLVRADQNGRIDNADNRAPDGIVGPHREKEGSFFAVKEIWSPVQIRATDRAFITPKELQHELDSRPPRDAFITPEELRQLRVDNHYDFTNLGDCRFAWRLLRVGNDSSSIQSALFNFEVTEVARGERPGPSVPPHESGVLILDVPPPEMPGREIVQVTALAPDGTELWRSSWRYVRSEPWLQGGRSVRAIPDRPIPVEEDATSLRVGRLRFQKSSGQLTGIQVAAGVVSPLVGPRWVGYRRDVRRFVEQPSSASVQSFEWRRNEPDVVVDVALSGPLQSMSWSIAPEGSVVLKYKYTFDGETDILGIAFDYPEANVKSKRWLGRGPYRVYRNRLEGGVLDVHELAYNDPIPGVTYAYPEFKGYFNDWSWLELETTEGTISFVNAYDTPYLGLYAPRDGEPSMLTFPDTGIAFLDVIPAIGTKFDFPEQLGPQSVTPHVSGVKTGTVVFRFRSPAQ